MTVMKCLVRLWLLELLGYPEGHRWYKPSQYELCLTLLSSRRMASNTKREYFLHPDCSSRASRIYRIHRKIRQELQERANQIGLMSVACRTSHQKTLRSWTFSEIFQMNSKWRFLKLRIFYTGSTCSQFQLDFMKYYPLSRYCFIYWFLYWNTFVKLNTEIILYTNK